MESTINLRSLFKVLLIRANLNPSIFEQAKIAYLKAPKCCHYLEKFAQPGEPRQATFRYCTQLSIESNVRSNLLPKIVAALTPIPLSIIFKRNGEVVGFKPEDIQSLQVIENTNTHTQYTNQSMLVAEKPVDSTDIRNLTADIEDGGIVNLDGVQEPMQSMIRAQIVDLKLPVYLQESGKVDIPKSTFVAAWNNLGRSLLAKEISFSSETQPISLPSDSQDFSKRIVVMSPRLKPEEITASDKPADIRKNLDILVERVNKAIYPSKEDVITAIASQSELGQKLMQKVIAAYKKANAAYKKAEASDKLTKKIIAECKKQLA